MAKVKSIASSVKSSRSAAKAVPVKRGSVRAGVASRAESAKPLAKPERPALAAQAVDAAGKRSTKKLKKDKPVRGTFTMPAADYGKISGLKKKCLAAGVGVKKSELLRAGLGLLERLSSEGLARAVRAQGINSGRRAVARNKTKGDKG